MMGIPGVGIPAFTTIPTMRSGMEAFVLCPPDIVVMLSQRFVVDFSRRDVRLLATVLADRIPVCEAVFGRAVF